MMPMLNYQCGDCGKKFEELVNAYNQDTLACPECNGHTLARIYEGKCLFGAQGGKGTGGCSHEGGCAGCAGCSH